MSKAQQIFDKEFRDCPRSGEWKAGALRGLQLSLDGDSPSGSPFRGGTAQDDAWRAGVEAGLRIGRDLLRFVQAIDAEVIGEVVA